MPPYREPYVPTKNNFFDFGQFVEAITNVIQSALRPSQRNTLDSVSRLKIDDFYGNEGSKNFEIWLNHVEKTF